MSAKKSYIPLKLLLSYIALAALVGVVAWFLYSENTLFTKNENKITVENQKILKVSQLLSNMYKAESFVRSTLQSDSNAEFNNYTQQIDTLKNEIDSLKTLTNSDYQKVLLDSVKILLSQKTENIRQLKIIKSKGTDDLAIKTALQKIDKMEGRLRKLEIEDLFKNPSKLQSNQRRVWEKYVEYINSNVPNDSTNTLSQKALDSMLTVSKKALKDVVLATASKKESLAVQEQKLLDNEILISEKLRRIVNILEKELVQNITINTENREKSLQKTNKIVAYAALVGFVLTISFLVLILNDFSKSQSYKKQLESANRATEKLLKNREQLIATVSHDLKTPLNTILGYTELLSTSELSKKQLNYTSNIKGSSEYISKLVQDLLDLTQIEAGKISIEALPFSLRKYIEEVATNIQAIYHTKPIELEIYIDESLDGLIVGDSFRLRQILTNLIGNAYKFTNEGSIRIEAAANEFLKTFTIKVIDTGIGIDLSKQQIIFEEFRQADDSVVKKYGGSGLGLTISKKMAELLGGNLQLESEVGVGSTFVLIFPLIKSTKIEKVEDLVPLSSLNLTAIVVDDDEGLLSLTTEVLQNAKIKVLSFSNPLLALQAAKNNDFDFIISDIQMPIIDGFKLLKLIQTDSDNNFSEQPTIALTGRTDLADSEYYDAGFTKVVKKPYTPNALLNCISKLFQAQQNDLELTSETIDNKSFYLDDLRAFTASDENKLVEILKIFINKSRLNLEALQTAYEGRDENTISNICHQMQPMLRQLRATKIANQLSEYEREPANIFINAEGFPNIKNEISDLLNEIEDSVNNPDRIS
ncbi:hybrid sensor histidine kinase/response regulator [Flavobacterium ardleyense]|uniref:hybrid sensor histidine kinase/response regulator n=1 Tax=Flavobacterium ardleyense TaxID=2038737 RepID=UPI00298D1655|nr:ATP-binding protein [Flavobacterium ardleyense]